MKSFHFEFKTTKARFANRAIYIKKKFLFYMEILNGYVKINKSLKIIIKKMDNKRPFGMTLLMVFLVWGVATTISTVFFKVDSIDMLLLDNYNLIWLGHLFALVLITLSAFSLYSILTKKKWGIIILNVFFLCNLVFTFFTMILSILNVEFVRDFHLQSRLDRNLTIEQIDFIMEPIVLIIFGGAYLLFYLFLFFYVKKNKKYFKN